MASLAPAAPPVAPPPRPVVQDLTPYALLLSVAALWCVLESVKGGGRMHRIWRLRREARRLRREIAGLASEVATSQDQGRGGRTRSDRGHRGPQLF